MDSLQRVRNSLTNFIKTLLNLEYAITFVRHEQQGKCGWSSTVLEL